MARQHPPEVKRQLDQLAEVMSKVKPERIAAVLDRNVRVNFNVTPQQHEEIRESAESCGLSVTDYFMRLHDLARRQLRHRAAFSAAQAEVNAGGDPWYTRELKAEIERRKQAKARKA